MSLFDDMMRDELYKNFNAIAAGFKALVQAVATLKVQVDRLEAKVDELAKEGKA